MIDELKPYPKYKDSGLPWLGSVPAHWDMKRMKHLFSIRNVRGFPDEPMLAATQTKGVVRKDYYGSRTVLALKDLHQLKLVEVGDFVISLRSFQGGIEYARHRGIISPAYTILYVKDAPAHGFFASLFKSRPFIDALRLYVTGIRQGQNIDYDRLSRSLLPIPPQDERQAIAVFVRKLIKECARFILNRRRLIEVLNEQKQAITYRAVTCGLDSKATLVESGITWAPEIPAHWQIIPNRGLFAFKKELVGARWSQFDLLSLTKRGVIMRDMENPEGKFPASFESYQVINPGDFVFCLFDVDETPRAVGVTSMPGMITGAYTRFECRHPEYSGFLYNYYLAMDFDKRLKPLYRGLRKVIQKEIFLTTKTPVPPVEEARQIVLHIEEQTRAADIAIEKAHREINLIIEYRTRLISDVVTGKIDVRHLAPHTGDENLEEMAEALEPLEDTMADVEMDEEELFNESD